jgi:chromosome segregation protein
MKFTKLRLLGFKTFVEPTDFLIEPGLTGVVGPNGCGKSNLVEALRWVMGENSTKAMRADDMEAVIFNGSGNRPGRNFAEVVLSVNNESRTAPAVFNEHDTLDVSRRIERDQGSTYRVNGREVRARDVQLLFADASSGSRSPALVRQGQIGELINAKPQARRRILEEAAGISGLHARRHEAELRLRAAEQNLERLEDVVAQLASQIEGLKRQSRQAVRYRGLSSEIRKVEATLFHLRWLAASAEAMEADRAVDLTVRQVAARTGEQAETAKQQAVTAHGLPALREAEAEAAAALQRLTLARDGIEREENRAKERLAELERRIGQLAADIEREQKMAQDADGVLARLTEERGVLGTEASGMAERQAAVTERVQAAESAVRELEKTFGDLTRALADLQARRGGLERAARDENDRLARLDQQLAQVARDRAAIEADSANRPNVERLAEAVTLVQAELKDAEAATLRAEAAQSGARQALDMARRPLGEADKRVQRLETEVRTLNKVLNVGATQMWPPVLDLIRVDKGFETALGAALGDDLDVPVDARAPVRWAGADITEADRPLPAGATPLTQHVRAPGELGRRLAQIGVVDKAAGAALAAQLAPGQRLVSREGDLWRWDGFAAAANAPTAAARRLAERNRLGDLEAELVQARQEQEARRVDLEKAEAEVRTAAQAEADARQAWRGKQRAADEARERHAAAERQAGQFTAKLSALDEAQTRLTASRDEAAGRLDEARAAIADLPVPGTLETDLAATRTGLDQRRAVLADARAEAAALQREADLRTRRLSAIEAEEREWRTRQAGAGSQIAALTVRLEEARQEKLALDDAPATFAQQRRSLIQEVEAAAANRRAAADKLAEAESALTNADRAARAALEAMAKAREDAVRAEERRDSAHRRIADLQREIVETLDVEPVALAKIAELEPDAKLPDIARTETDLTRLKAERERLGGVNLRADEELQEVQAQHDGLIRERDDLVEAIRKLRAGIQSLNREARERLAASFATVNSHFQRLFTTLFGGGTAELQLIESDDPLEAGLDILAKPPGKKPQTLSLLSGGEQALTAMALIFAVFLTNPAPICVLDEVDAPLDDSNVERFCDLLDAMAGQTDTRFVTITHNPITMARMDRLFGVTMAERGVSQLVSVDLETATRIRDAS